MNFCLAIATYNRPDELDRCLKSAFKQSVLPSRLLIIDDGQLSSKQREDISRQAESHGLVFQYYKKDHSYQRQGLAESKNLALELVNEEIIFFLDDDIVLEPEFFSSIMSRWQESWLDEELLGIGGIIINNRCRRQAEKIYHSIFGLSSRLSWDITAQAFQVWDDKITKLCRGYYAHGGLLSLRRTTALKLGFATFSGGRTALEDVDFSWRAKNQGYHFLIEPLARANHKHSQVGREKSYLSGYKEGRNRQIIYYQFGHHSLPENISFAWAHLGWIGRQFISGHFSKGWGMFRGAISRR